MSYTASQIAEYCQGKVHGDASIWLKGFAPADQAESGDLTFAETPAYFQKADQSNAAAILVNQEFPDATKVLIQVDNPRVAFARVLELFYPEPRPQPGIHSTALVDQSAQIDSAASVGPYCIVEEKVEIGPDTVIAGHCHIGAGSRIGSQCKLFPQVTLYPRTQIGNSVRIHSGSTLGSDGFGYVFHQGQHRKIPQVGYVEIGDEVEIGANVTIDRGALGATRIGRGTRIDNLVMIAHNVVIGEYCILVAQCGIAGSTRIGNYVTIAGQVGIAGHLKIGDRVTIAGKSGVMHDIPAGEKWMGVPARPDRQMKRILLAMEQLPKLVRKASAFFKDAK